MVLHALHSLDYACRGGHLDEPIAAMRRLNPPWIAEWTCGS